MLDFVLTGRAGGPGTLLAISAQVANSYLAREIIHQLGVRDREIRVGDVDGIDDLNAVIVAITDATRLIEASLGVVPIDLPPIGKYGAIALDTCGGIRRRFATDLDEGAVSRVVLKGERQISGTTNGRTVNIVVIVSIAIVISLTTQTQKVTAAIRENDLHFYRAKTGEIGALAVVGRGTIFHDDAVIVRVAPARLFGPD